MRKGSILISLLIVLLVVPSSATAVDPMGYYGYSAMPPPGEGFGPYHSTRLSPVALTQGGYLATAPDFWDYGSVAYPPPGGFGPNHSKWLSMVAVQQPVYGTPQFYRRPSPYVGAESIIPQYRPQRWVHHPRLSPAQYYEVPVWEGPGPGPVPTNQWMGY
jgi:hypothetical protein